MWFQLRIKSEHAVGSLKGRFQSLKGLRQQIKNEKDHFQALEWVRTCIVIHTLIHDIEFSGYEEHDAIANYSSSSSDEGYAPTESLYESVGVRKRHKVKAGLFQSHLFDN